MMTGIEPGHTAEKQAVARHGEINTRRGEHGLAKKAESGDGDSDREQARAGLAECAAHYFGGGRGVCGEAGWAEHAYADEIYAEIKKNDADHAVDQGAGEISARVADFCGDEVGCLPAAIGEEDWD